MYKAFVSLFRFDALFDPVGVPLGKTGYQWAAVWAIVFCVGFAVRLWLHFSGPTNPFLSKRLHALASVLLWEGVLLSAYFLIREQRVAYLTSNVVFFLVFSFGSILFLYALVYQLGFVYRRERLLYAVKQKHEQYLPKHRK